jgi:solute:Na+ symporter, SSS family
MYLFLLAAQVWAVLTFTQFANALMPGGWMPWALLGMTAVAALTYPIIGGLRKDITTDTVQMIIISLGGIVLLYGLLRAGVPGRMWSELPRTHLTGMGDPGKNYGTMVIGSAIFVPTLFLVRMDMWQRVAACKAGKGLACALMLAGVGSALFFALFTLVGIWGRLDGPTSADRVTLTMITRHVTHPESLGLVVGALYAAVLSSADTFINNGSIFAARVIAPGSWQRHMASKTGGGSRLLIVERIAAFAVLVVAVGLGLVAQDYVELLAGAFALLLVYVGPVVSTLFECRRSEPAAFWAPLAAGVLFIVMFFCWEPKIAAPLAAVLALLLYLGGVFLGRVAPAGPNNDQRSFGRNPSRSD